MVGLRLDTPADLLMEGDSFTICIVLSNVPDDGRVVPITVEVGPPSQEVKLSPNFPPCKQSILLYEYILYQSYSKLVTYRHFVILYLTFYSSSCLLSISKLSTP